MNYLLDTCAFLWLVNGSEDLSPRAREAIDAPTATLYLSVLTAAELSIKAGKGRIQLPSPVESWIRDAVRLHHLTLLPLERGQDMRRATIRTRGPFSSLAQRMTLSQRHPATPPPLRRGFPQPDPGTILTTARRCGAPTDGSPQRQLWVRVQNEASPGRGDRIPVALATTEDLFAVHVSAAFHPRRPTTPRNPTIVLKLALAPIGTNPPPTLLIP